MKIETLNLEKEKKKETLKVDEMMDSNGSWVEDTGNFRLEKNPIIVELQYCSLCHHYYLIQEKSGEHTLFRRIKE